MNFQKPIYFTFLSLWCVVLVFGSFLGCNVEDQEPVIEEPVVEKEPVVEQPPPVVPVVPEKPVNGEVGVYISEFWWIVPLDLIEESGEMAVQLQASGIRAVGLVDAHEVRAWMIETKGNGAIDVLVLYGDVPDTIYPPGNRQPDGSLAETWLETTDGDTILNHADWIFWGGEKAKNREAGLQNIMDIPGITMWGDNTPMRVTVSGRAITPTLKNFQSDRPFPLDQLRGNWFAELILASNTGDENATRADPVVVRDGDLGRIAIVYQTFEQDDPKGKVAAEIIINHLMK